MYLIIKENEKKKKNLSIVKIDSHTKSNQLVGKRNKFTFFEVDITFCSTFFFHYIQNDGKKFEVVGNQVK